MKTTNYWLLTAAAVTALSLPVCAQTSERRAKYTGGGGGDTGKCTIEVYVDGAADVEILGDRGIIRTLSGQPAQWRRFECSGQMPANASEIRFNGIDGRGRQDVIQNQRNDSRGIVVRIQDRDGGAVGYTFDLEWRGSAYNPGYNSGPTNQMQYVAYRSGATNESVRVCEESVRQRAKQQYGLRNITFRNLSADDNPGRNDTIVGTFDARRGDSRAAYRFSCALSLDNGSIRDVNISQGQGVASTDRYGYGNDASSACQRAAEQRIYRDGYRNVQFGWLDAGNSRNGRLAGTATAQRGDYGQEYNFDIKCTVDLANGNIRSVNAKRR